MSRTGLYLPYLSYASVLTHMYVFTLDSSVGVIPCMPIPLVEIYGHVLPGTPAFSAETHLYALTRYSMNTEMSVHALMIFCARGIRAHLLNLPCTCTSACLYVHARASVSICACAHTSIHACGGFSSCLSVVLPNTLL